MRISTATRTVAMAITVAACGNPQPSSGASTGTPDAHMASMTAPARYLPLAVGAKWTYNATDPMTGVTGPTQSVVEAMEDVGGAKAGVKAFKVNSTTLIG